MANKLGRLTIDIAADVASLRRDMDQAQRTVKRGVDGMSRSATTARKALTGIASGLLAGVSVVAIKNMVRETNAVIDAQAKFADVIGLTTEQLAGYQLAAKISGVELGQLNTGMTRLQKNIADAEAGLKTATREFDKLGLSASQLKKLSTDDQLKLIADRFAELNSTVDKSSVLLNLFGRSGIALGKLLEQGSGSIERFQDESQKLGLSLSRLDSAKVEAANDALARSASIAEGLKRQLSVGLAPAIKAVGDLYVEASLSAGGFGSVSEQLGRVAAESLGGIGNTLEEVGQYIDKANIKIAKLSIVMLKARRSLSQVSPLNFVGGLFGVDNGDVLAGFDKRIQDYETLLSEASSSVARGEDRVLSEGSFSERLKARLSSDLEAIKSSLEGGSLGASVVPVSVDEKAAKAVESSLKSVQAAIAAAQPPLKQYADQVAVIDSLLAGGKLSQGEYNNALAIYKQRLDDAMGVNDQWKKDLADAASFADSAKTEIDKLNEELARAKELAKDGLISPDVLAKTEERITKSLEAAKKGTDEMSVFAEQAARNIQDQFGASIRQTLEGDFDGILSSWKDLIYKMGSEALAADIAETFGLKDLLTGEGGGGILKKAFSSASSFFGGDKENAAASAVGAASSTAESAASAAQLSSASLLSAAATALTGSAASISGASAADSAAMSAAVASLSASIPAALIGPATSLTTAGVGLNASAALLSAAAAALTAGSAADAVSGAASGAGNLLSFDGGGFTGPGSRSGGLDGKGGFLSMVHPNETVIDHTKGQGIGGGVQIGSMVFPNVTNANEARQCTAVAARELQKMISSSRRY